MAALHIPPSRRRKILIHPQFQLLLLGVNLGVIVLFTAVVCATVRNTLLDLKPAAGLTSEQAAFFKQYVDYQAGAFQRAILSGCLLGMAVSGVVTLVASHRIAGPLVRMKGFFRQICERPEARPLPRLEFREGDFIRDLPPLVNHALDQIAQVERKAEKAGQKAA